MNSGAGEHGAATLPADPLPSVGLGFRFPAGPFRFRTVGCLGLMGSTSSVQRGGGLEEWVRPWAVSIMGIRRVIAVASVSSTGQAPNRCNEGALTRPSKYLACARPLSSAVVSIFRLFATPV